jgi:hypothetical protein
MVGTRSVNAVSLCPHCDNELLVGVCVMPWIVTDGDNNKAKEDEESSPTSAKKRKTKDDGKSGTARVSLDGMSINSTAKAGTQSSEESNSSDDDAGRRKKRFTFDLRPFSYTVLFTIDLVVNDVQSRVWWAVTYNVAVFQDDPNIISSLN